MNHTVEYILRFLLGDACTPQILSAIGYTSAISDSQYKLIIKPSSFFDEKQYGLKESLPQLPLKTIHDIPLLYGNPEIIKQGDTLVVHADLIASAYFFLTGYESFVRKGIRDKHGRFSGKESLAFREGFIHRPIVDEYGRLLRQYVRDAGMDIAEPVARIKKIYLTHDIDIPYYYRTWKGVLRGCLIDKNIQATIRACRHRELDPAYTYPFLIEQDKQLIEEGGTERCESVFFFKAMGGCPEDKPVYNLFSEDIQHLFQLCKAHNIRIGLHSSYYAGIYPERIAQEKNSLKQAIQMSILYNRHHYLSCRNMEDLQYLVKAGITDDFTMGYADVAGFRLGTCRSIQWINAADRTIYPLILHPMTLMERTLDSDYMNFSYEEAIHYIMGLIDVTEQYGGDLVLLWHNTSVSSSSNYHKALYELLINNLKKR